MASRLHSYDSGLGVCWLRRLPFQPDIPSLIRPGTLWLIMYRHRLQIASASELAFLLDARCHVAVYHQRSSWEAAW